MIQVITAQVPTELIVYGVLFLLILIFNFIARRLSRQQPQEQGPEHEAAREEDEYESSDEFWGRVKPAPLVAAPSVAPKRIERVRPRAPAPRRTRYTRESLIGGRRDLQRAIVLMTVLGPCRANDQSQHPR